MFSEGEHNFRPNQEEEKFCEICLSTSHTTDQCDVKREKHLLEVQRWTESILPALGVRAEKQTITAEGVVDYSLFDAQSGKAIGELEILDEQRAIRAIGAKPYGGWDSMLTFSFIAPDGSNLKLAGAPQPIEQILVEGVNFMRDKDRWGTTSQQAEKEHKQDENIAQDWGLTKEQWQFVQKFKHNLAREAMSLNGEKAQDFLNLIDRWQGRFAAVNERPQTRYLTNDEMEELVFHQHMTPQQKDQFMNKFGADLQEYKRLGAIMSDHKLKQEAKKRGVAVEDWRFIQNVSREMSKLQADLDLDGRFLFTQLTTGWRLRGPQDPQCLTTEQKLLPLLNEVQKKHFETLKSNALQYYELWNKIDRKAPSS